MRIAKYLTFACVAVGCSVFASSAGAATVWGVEALANTTAKPGSKMHFMVTIVNYGRTATAGPYTVTMRLPEGLVPVEALPMEYGGAPCQVNTVARTIACTGSASLFSHAMNGTTFTVKVAASSGAPVARFEVAGGEAGGEPVASGQTTKTVRIQALPPEFGFEGFDSEFDDTAGGRYTQAGGHPGEVVTSFELNSTTNLTIPNQFPAGSPGGQEAIPIEPMKTIAVDLPAGFVADPTHLPRCTLSEMLDVAVALTWWPQCPLGSQVGTLTFSANKAGTNVFGPYPIFNMVAPAGGPARLATAVFGVPVVIDASLRSRGETQTLAVRTYDTSEALPVIEVTTKFWGVPADPSHDSERGCPGQYQPYDGGPTCTGGSSAPYLRMPTSCTAPGEGLDWRIQADSWLHPGALSADGEPVSGDPAWKSMGLISHDLPDYPSAQQPEWGAPVGSNGCDRVPVKGKLAAQPTSLETEVPSGLAVHVDVPNPGIANPEGIASSDIKGVKVALPVGMTINPSQAEGLGVCTQAQFESSELLAHPDPSKGCPANSKIGNVVVHTSLLEEAIEGNVYIAQPYENKFGSLLAIYLVLENLERGILIRQAGHVETDPVTGQITTTFDNMPQLPFSSFDFKFREGARAPLVTPAACGTYTTQAWFTPWSDPSSTILSPSQFQIVAGIGGGACPAGGTPPFAPQVISGTRNNAGGAYSPFDLHLTRQDGEQEITKFTTVLPPGLTGNLTGIPFCPDAAIEAARNKTGAQEIAEPSCPAASEVGHTIVGAGVGSVLAHTPGKVYLAGPYHGASLSIVSVTSATVGPFDLGTVVIRFGLRINPTTAQVEVDATGSDPIPHIIDGIVVHVRDIRVYVDRAKFIRNPTNCEPMSVTNTITGAGADYTNPADQNPVSVTAHFQAADCSLLGFKPTFKASTSGKTSRAAGASLHVTLTYPKAPEGSQANVRSVKVDLPKQLPSRLTTLQKACPDSTFNANPAACPPASRVGTAKAITPILPEPLTGPAYFVSHGGAKFPELIVVIQGYGFTIDLHGETFINKEGVTSSTFRSVPDQPVTSFELTLPQGPDSALAANGNLCSVTRTVLVKKRVKVRSKGHTRTVTRKVRKTLPATLQMPTAFTAQNGAVIHQNTPITVTGCARHKAKKAKAHRRTTHKKK